jgi:site-specific DNA-methyltransferase (adenine-specific)
MDDAYLMLGDCAEKLIELQDNSIDLVVTSPPYGNLRNYRGYSFDFKLVAVQLKRVIKQGGVIVWVVGDATINGSESGISFRQALFFKQIGLNLHDTMIYKKLNSTPLTHNRYQQEFEFIFVFSKGKPNSFNPIKIKCKFAGQTTWGKPSLYKDNSGSLSEVLPYVIKDFKIRGNIFEYRVGSTQKNKEIKHPAVFPIQLAADQIYTWSNEGDAVLDPFMGSGTTAIAAIKLNRKFIGCEISQEYFEMAKNRIDKILSEKPSNINKYE